MHKLYVFVRMIAPRILISLITLLICFGFAELYVRIFRPQPTYGFYKNMMMADDEIGYRATPLSSGWIRQPEYSNWMETNSQGWRGRKEYDLTPPKGGRVFFIGDSFTQAYYSTEDKTVVGLLNSRWASKDREVINAGVGGYGPVEELLAAKRLAPYNPKVVVWMIYVGNDFLDAARPLLTVKDGDIANTVTSTPPHFSIPERIRMKINSILSRHSQLWSLFMIELHYSPRLNFLNNWPLFSGARQRTYDVSAEGRAIYYKDVLSKQEEIWDEKSAPLLQDLRAVMPNTNVVAVLIPTNEQIDSGKWASAKKLYPDLSDDNRYLAQAWLKDWLSAHGVKSLDVVAPLSEAQVKKPVYFFVDGHWNDYGQQVAAEKIGDFLDPLLSNMTVPRAFGNSFRNASPDP